MVGDVVTCGRQSRRRLQAGALRQQRRRDRAAGNRGSGGELWPQLTNAGRGTRQAWISPSEEDIDEFVDLLGKFERGEMAPEDWRRFRLTRGTYGQRQDGVQMLRVKAPQGVVEQRPDARACDRGRRYSRGFCHVTTRQNIQLHFVLLKDCEDGDARSWRDEGLTTREACGNAVRNITGCPTCRHVAQRDLRRVAVRRGADALLPAASAGRVAAAQVQDRVRGCAEDHALASINDLGWRAKILDGKRGFRVTVAGGTSIMPVTRLRALRVPARGRDARTWPRPCCACSTGFGDYQHRQQEPHEVHGEAAGLGGVPRQGGGGTACRSSWLPVVRRCS